MQPSNKSAYLPFGVDAVVELTSDIAACPTLPLPDLEVGATQLSDALPEGTQGHFRSILTDEYLRVIGSEGTIYAMGDGATIFQVRLCLYPAKARLPIGLACPWQLLAGGPWRQAYPC